MAAAIDYSKWEKIIDAEAEEDEEEEAPRFDPNDRSGCPQFTDPRYPQFTDPLAESNMSRVYAEELPREHQTDKLKESKIRMAMDAYERRRPKDKVMHHYWIKEAGDPECIGEYYPTGDSRNDTPVYQNDRGIILSREEQPADVDGNEYFGWVLGNMEERRPVYGVMTEDVSVPTLGWQAFTGPEPVPTIRYYSHASAAKSYKDRANIAFQKKSWDEAEYLYTQALECTMDPKEFAEPLAMILSNRAETRLRKLNHEGAEEDAEQAMQHLKTVASNEEPTQKLRQKTVIRRAKALQMQRRFAEAAKLLREARSSFPESQEIERLLEEMEVSMKGAGGKAAARAFAGGPARGSTATEQVLRYMTQTVETMQEDIASIGDKACDYAFPEKLAHTLKKIEYILVKAKTVQGECLRDLQTVLRTNGGLHSLLQLVQRQFKSNIDGKAVDTFKVHGLASVCVVISHAADGSIDNLKVAASEAHVFLAVLGGCNRKVEVDVCERLIALASLLWEQCKSRTLELVQPCSVVVERAAAFLSRVVLADLTDDAGGPDAPTLAQPQKDQALALLFEWLAAGGRVERRALRGAAPQLADAEGAGFFTAEQLQVQELGELVARKAAAEPSLTSVTAVRHLLQAVQLLLLSGPLADADDSDICCLGFDEYKPDGSFMRYVDLDGWELSEDGRHASLLLLILARTLEFRLLLKGRELDKDDFEMAFMDGNGFFVVIPLIQAPLAFAEHALLCLSAMVRANHEHAHNIAGFQTMRPFLGLPTPESKPMPSCMGASLRESAAARRHAAKILQRCIESHVFQELFAQNGDKTMKELVRLIVSIRADGKASLEAFHDMIVVFYGFAQLRPGAFCHYVPVELMNLLVDVTTQQDGEPAAMASDTIKILMKDRKCEALLLPIINQAEGAKAYDVEDELKSLHKTLTPAMNQID